MMLNLKATLNFENPVPLLHGCSFTAVARCLLRQLEVQELSFFYNFFGY
jgi:hypothetical protein